MTVIVKLGGSLAESGTLRSWLGLLEKYGGGRCVVVPGGGLFADAVREAQLQHGFSELAAHRMAILAMEQYALLLADWAPSLRLCASIEEMRAALAAGSLALWLPSRLAWADPEIPPRWEVTSDSLAAWLARRIAAERLILVKSAPPPAPPLSSAGLAEAGLVDPAFPAYMAQARCALDYCTAGDELRLAKEIASR